MEELSPKVQKAVQVALHQARQWRCPIHWDGKEWQKELDAIAQAAAFEACFYFDEQRGITLEIFVFWQVLTALRDFRRREWAYFAFHCGHLTKASDEGELGEGDESAEVCEGVAAKGLEQEWRRCLIFWALERLSERERQVINRLYWDGHTEAEIAHELGISQQAVSKIKRKAIQKLRELLEGLL
jgi:RNA polymerase sigma factor (sigma-70 family)